MIRVLEVLATLKRAGAEVMASSLATRLDRGRFRPGVLTLFNETPGDLGPIVESADVPLWRLGKKPGLDFNMYPRLRAAFAEFRPDVIHTHSYVLRYVLPVAGRAAIVHSVHNLAGQEVDRIGLWIHKAAFKLKRVTPIAVASEVALSFRQIYGFTPGTIPNGIDLARFNRPRREAGQNREIRIVSVARLDPQKNPLALVEAFREMPEYCRLLMAGDGSLRAALRGIHPRVELLGIVADTPELLAGCDIFALASDWEGHPLALMEAMASGLAVVATRVGGVPEIVGDAGLLVPPGDVRALSASLLRLVQNPGLRDELGNRARLRARNFGIADMVSAYSDLFDRVRRPGP